MAYHCTLKAVALISLFDIVEVTFLLEETP